MEGVPAPALAAMLVQGWFPSFGIGCHSQDGARLGHHPSKTESQIQISLEYGPQKLLEIKYGGLAKS